MEALEVMNQHRTYRNFDETYQLSEAELQKILQASRQAPSWMNGQMYSIKGYGDPPAARGNESWKFSYAA